MLLYQDICWFYFQRVLYEDMPRINFFDLLHETDQEFIQRTGLNFYDKNHLKMQRIYQ